MSLAGKLLYHGWHRPIGDIRRSIRHGGPIRQWRVARARDEMIQAASALPALPTRPGEPVTLHFLTGKRFAYQTAFCLHTFARHSPVSVTAEFYDDGSLDCETTDLLTRLAPGARIHLHAELKERLETILPTSRFPTLRERWLNYPHIRKLIDVHAGRAGWRLVLDSDLLFWREPRLLLDWLTTPQAPLYATDCTENYGYPRSTLEVLAGKALPSLVNVGLCGWRSESIDWEFLEFVATSLIQNHGTSYYLEQGLVALMAAAHEDRTVVAPAADYITAPTPAEILHPTAAMHHYVDLSRDDYHLTAWRRVISK